MAELISDRALGRATLARQHLLGRTRRSALDVVSDLAGMQGQDPELPYIGLWDRIDGFRHDDLTELLHRREVVRGTLFRGTQHLLATDDYLWMRPLLQPMLDGWQRGTFGRHTAGIDPAALAGAARELLADGTLSRPELGRALAERWPGREPRGGAGGGGGGGGAGGGATVAGPVGAGTAAGAASAAGRNLGPPGCDAVRSGRTVPGPAADRARDRRADPALPGRLRPGIA